MNPNTKILLDEIARLFDEQNARWDGRFAAAPSCGVSDPEEPLREASACGDRAVAATSSCYSTGVPSEPTLSTSASYGGNTTSLASALLPVASTATIAEEIVTVAKETVTDSISAAAAPLAIDAALSDVVIDAPTKCLREFLSTDVNVQASVYAAEGPLTSPPTHASPGTPTLSLHTSSLKSQVHINVSNHYLFDEMPLCHGVFHLCNMSLFASKSIITGVLGSPRTYIVLLCPATNACDGHNVFGQVNQHDSVLLWPLPKGPWPPPKQLKVMHDEVDLRPTL